MFSHELDICFSYSVPTAAKTLHHVGVVSGRMVRVILANKPEVSSSRVRLCLGK
ncbi:hypothetical protein Taro_012089 [Colocasia esculenta]|uniref:Uncharacterized protein n=1 Tax=Colocasia esculenta TaxID=4460 RepID=A0A843U843_COLES|nr:hypothetical protein [Colocasia esculenta]